MQPDGERRRFCCGVIFRVPDPPVLRVGSPAPASRKVGTKINRKTATTTATKTDPYNSKGRAPGKSQLQGRCGTAHAGANLRRFSGEELLEEPLAPREKRCGLGGGGNCASARLSLLQRRRRFTVCIGRRIAIAPAEKTLNAGPGYQQYARVLLFERLLHLGPLRFAKESVAEFDEPLSFPG